MRNVMAACLAAACVSGALAGTAAPAHEAADAGAAIAAAVSDASRPEADRERDALRAPAETLRFSGVKPGDVVADYVSGSGYFTRLLLSVVGPQGHVYSVEPSTVLKYVAKELPDIEALTATHPNLTVSVASPMEGTRFPQKLDLFFIAQNYHDMHDKFMGPVDIGAFNAAVYKALKPGGIYLVLDHVAASGAPADVTETLHRIDPAVVRREVEAAGFKFDGESRVLANPDDPHSVGVFDKSIRGHTDQFIYRFRKPH